MGWGKLARAVAGLFLLMAACGTARGQSGLDPGQLPRSTVFYLAWHGTPRGDQRKANSLLALWDDPEFAPLRSEIIEGLAGRSPKNKTTQPELTRDELAEVASLLDNEFVVGYMSDPAKASSNVAKSPPAHRWEGAFMVYDRSGKEATLAKLMVRARMSEKDSLKISTTTISGIAAMKLERTSGSTSYWAEDGKYAFSASEPAVFEQIAAWARHGSPEAGWLAKTAAYQEAAAQMHGGLIEFFLHLPSVKNLATDASPGGFRLGPLLQNLHIDAVHVMAGHLMLDGARTRIQGAILGDTSAGTPFDIWSDAIADPASMRLINESTISYTSAQINFAGIYGLIKRALKPAGSNSQRGPSDFLEEAAETRLGMPVTEALGVFSGELASVASGASFDPARQVYFVGIHRKPEALKLLRAGLEERLTGERTEGDVTFFRVSEGGIHSEAGTASWKYYHLAVAPDAILISGRSESLRAALTARRNSPEHLPQAWRKARENFPESINSLSFVDLAKFDWTAIQNRWNAEAARAAEKTSTKPATEPTPIGRAVSKFNPQLLQRHLHFAASATWKDAQGLHLDSWIE